MIAALFLGVAWAQNVGLPGVTIFGAALVAALAWAVSGVVKVVVTIIAAAVFCAVARAKRVFRVLVIFAAVGL